MKKAKALLVLLALSFSALPAFSQAHIKNAIEMKIDDLVSAKTLDAKLKALAALKSMISNQSDAINRRIQELQANNNPVANDGADAMDSTPIAKADSSDEPAGLQQAQPEKNTAEIEKQKKLSLELNYYEVKLEPLFNLFLNEKNESKLVSNKSLCKNIEARLREKSPIKNSVHSRLNTLMIARDMCDLAN